MPVKNAGILNSMSAGIRHLSRPFLHAFLNSITLSDELFTRASNDIWNFVERTYDMVGFKS
jgi:hypothetical protein